MSIEQRNKIADLERRVAALESRALLPAVDVFPLEELMRDKPQPGKTLKLPENRKPHG